MLSDLAKEVFNQDLRQELVMWKILCRILPPSWTLAGQFHVNGNAYYYHVESKISEFIASLEQTIDQAAQEQKNVRDRPLPGLSPCAWPMIGSMFGGSRSDVSLSGAGLDVDLCLSDDDKRLVIRYAAAQSTEQALILGRLARVLATRDQFLQVRNAFPDLSSQIFTRDQIQNQLNLIQKFLMREYNLPEQGFAEELTRRLQNEEIWDTAPVCRWQSLYGLKQDLDNDPECPYLETITNTMPTEAPKQP